MSARDEYQAATRTPHHSRRNRLRTAIRSLGAKIERGGFRLRVALALNFKSQPQYRTRYLDGSKMPVREMRQYRGLTYLCWGLELAIAAAMVLLIIILITGS